MTPHDLYQVKLSVIIPTINEAACIGATLKSIQNARNIEVIVADGGSEDRTRVIAASFGARVLVCQKGRAQQMNYGASVATGAILLFLHGDTLLPDGFDINLRRLLLKPGIVAGSFRLRIASRRFGFRLLEALINLRSTVLQMPYGDQGLFLKASTFQELGGFPQLPIMEDFVFVKQLKKQGRIVISSSTVLTSARRWERLGIVKATIVNQVIITAFHLGVNPSRLAGWYNQTQGH
jgi:rSAM/selenodomain-associated transferase 2